MLQFPQFVLLAPLDKVKKESNMLNLVPTSEFIKEMEILLALKFINYKLCLEICLCILQYVSSIVYFMLVVFFQWVEQKSFCFGEIERYL